ncbi:CDP-diacylglycerol--serine O-phosphatidyltransferase [Alkalicoccobacillus murimartini]|uniref:CDP-diacylglycerol--serine O-phosphatidyltransferase n=1 Tax=Alkalicoccobacillus murimartini TaxID=171685 RepID=A0ABT9YCC0_9BACI|nr:CDP-diacylglycerol--serine O-phosphatidyltransferase [Alkalicoccobacillus murimartini]MDQ0205492.1 CDP-diacylglycerol--serine O-phosphatidyltransferase [Alkalicoccobacillus murimartini]
MFLLHRLDASLRKLKGQIANALTLINLGFGALAIIYVFHGQLQVGLLLIAIAAVFDRLDGAAARKFNATSELGKQLDSLSDIISFGVAPAMLIYQAALSEFNLTGGIFTIIYIMCGALRLARFNVTDSSGFFVGLPITAAGCILAFLTLFVNHLPIYVFMYAIIGLSLLMVSPFRVRKI